MIFIETKLKGAFLIKPELHEDERGFFARTWCAREIEAHGLNPKLEQCSISFNKTKGTLRGLHYQAAPFEEAKLVRCARGAIYDVVIDLRPDSITFKQWVSAELSADNHLMFYIPEGMAHGFQTLCHETEVSYQMSEAYHPDHARGVRWDDPSFDLHWPASERIISPRDQQYPDFVR